MTQLLNAPQIMLACWARPQASAEPRQRASALYVTVVFGYLKIPQKKKGNGVNSCKLGELFD